MVHPMRFGGPPVHTFEQCSFYFSLQQMAELHHGPSPIFQCRRAVSSHSHLFFQISWAGFCAATWKCTRRCYLKTHRMQRNDSTKSRLQSCSTSSAVSTWPTRAANGRRSGSRVLHSDVSLDWCWKLYVRTQCACFATYPLAGWRMLSERATYLGCSKPLAHPCPLLALLEIPEGTSFSVGGSHCWINWQLASVPIHGGVRLICLKTQRVQRNDSTKSRLRAPKLRSLHLADTRRQWSVI